MFFMYSEVFMINSVCPSRVPETSKMRDRMLYASTGNGLKEKLEGIHRKVEAFDEDELDFEAIKKKVLQ